MMGKTLTSILAEMVNYTITFDNKEFNEHTL